MLDQKNEKKTYSIQEFFHSPQFRERLLNSNIWVSKAKELLSAACLLEKEVISQWENLKANNKKTVAFIPNLQGVHFMLIAYAIENLCKAIIIHKQRDKLRNRPITNIAKDFKDIKGHNLVRLVKKINMKIDIVEEELLIRLSRNSTWEGRYPTPMKSIDIVGNKRLSNGNNYLTAYYSPNDIDKARKFLNRLFQKVKEKLMITI